MTGDGMALTPDIVFHLWSGRPSDDVRGSISLVREPCLTTRNSFHDPEETRLRGTLSQRVPMRRLRSLQSSYEGDVIGCQACYVDR